MNLTHQSARHLATRTRLQQQQRRAAMLQRSTQEVTPQGDAAPALN